MSSDNRHTVLCVDDEKDILTLYSDSIDSEKYNVKTFLSPSEALEFLENHHTEVAFVFSDFEMKDLNGFQFREKMQEKGFDIPFALITAFYSKEMALKGMNLNICTFVQKPFNFNDVNDILATYAARRIEEIEEEKEMILSFVEETVPMLDEIEDLILVLEENPQDQTALNTYFRLLHTIKGTSSCVGLKSIPAYAHEYENLISRVQKNEISLNDQVASVLLKGLDDLKFMFSEVIDNKVFEFDIEEKVRIFDLTQNPNQEIQDVAETTAKTPQASFQANSEDVVEKISVPVPKLDYLMEMSGELTVLRNTLVKTLEVLEEKHSQSRETEIFSDTLEELQKVSSLIQGGLSDVRKVSLQTVTRPLKRIICDVTKTMDKEINFNIYNESIDVDTAIGKILSNTLVHLVRNGVDHGLETRDERLKAGKPVEGDLKIEFEEDEENIHCRIIDDGKGINCEALKNKAIEKGIASREELDLLPQSMIFALIFHSGFSTAAEVTDISGRGVGMDMVRSSVEDIGGKIQIQSELGVGTTFHLILPKPKSVMIIKSLLVKIKEGTYTIPIDDISEVLLVDDLSRDMIIELEGVNVIKHHGVLIPLVDISDFWEQGQTVNIHKDECAIVIVRHADYQFGLVASDIFDIEEVVVKKLNSCLSKIPSFSGASFVANGEVSLILNIEGLAKEMALVGEHAIRKHEDQTAMEESTVNNNYEEYILCDFMNKKGYAVELDKIVRLEEFSKSRVEFSGRNALVRYDNSFLKLLFTEKVLGFTSLSFSDYLNTNECINVAVVDVEGQKYGLVVEQIKDISLSYEPLDSIAVNNDAFKGVTFIDQKAITVLDVDVLVRKYNSMDSGESEDDSDPALLIAS